MPNRACHYATDLALTDLAMSRQAHPIRASPYLQRPAEPAETFPTRTGRTRSHLAVPAARGPTSTSLSIPHRDAPQLTATLPDSPVHTCHAKYKSTPQPAADASRLLSSSPQKRLPVLSSPRTSAGTAPFLPERLPVVACGFPVPT